MNSERFKFRCWAKSNGKMYMFGTFSIESANIQLLGHLSDPEPIIMQSTGLKDKNGVLIFESDIIMYRDISGSGRPREFGPRTVKWNTNACSFNVSKTASCAEFEIIGNIYQDSHLLDKPEQ